MLTPNVEWIYRKRVSRLERSTGSMVPEDFKIADEDRRQVDGDDGNQRQQGLGRAVERCHGDGGAGDESQEVSSRSQRGRGDARPDAELDREIGI